MNAEQIAAVEAEGEVFVSAGAGTGKTKVLVDRYARSVCQLGLDVESVLVITYTKNAASELRTRIRARLIELGRPELAQRLDGAWISTIHSFCARLLRAHPFAVGIDPGFRELDGEQGAVLQAEAFDRALERFCEGEESERLRLLATYGSAKLRRMLTGVYDRLRSAARGLTFEPAQEPRLDEALAALQAAASALAADPGATEKQQQVAATASELPLRAVALIELGHLRASGARAAAYEDARKRVEKTALDTLALADRELLQTLLNLFAAEYATAKEREGTLDFEDLQLVARDLLRANDEIREREQLRFRAIMVDEFQDTNALQCDLIDLLAAGPTKDVFYVGDEFQSIYGFRHADVEVFRQRRAAATQRLPLTENYRSRPEVLAAVNYLFRQAFGDGYQHLTSSGEFPDPIFGHPVELLVTDKPSYSGSGEHWRRAEARHVARRVRELVDTGAATPGEIVLLFQAGTDAEWYEDELRQLRLPTYRSTGRRYFGQQQVVDLLMYLRLLRNRYDDEAVAAVLASPFVGASNDAIVLVRRHAARRPLFCGIERTLPPALDAHDERLIRAFKQRFERLVAASERVSLEHLCELVVCAHDYDLAVLARWDGTRRYANLRKLMRLARSYEEMRGRDLEGFVEFIRSQEAVGASQLEAVSEEEGADAVRLLTIHSAKGLEFKVVVVADAGRDRAGPPAADEILALADGRFGFKIVDPLTGEPRAVFDYDEVKDARKAIEEEERLRLYYVAMTRAKERLIVSGSIDEKRDTPIGWVLERLDCETELAGTEGPFELMRDGASFLVHVDRRIEDAHAAEGELAPDEAEPDASQLALFAEVPATPIARGYRLPELPPIAPPALHHPRRLSYSALSLFDRCSYRYYAERVAGLREERRAGGGTGMLATEIGDAVHRLLELVDPQAPAVPAVDIVQTWYPAITAAERERVAELVAAYCDSDLARRVAALPDVRPERPFAFEHDGVLIHGRLDLLQRHEGRALVVDYKTNRLGERTPAEIVAAEYRVQQLVYALACFRAGSEEVEVVYTFLERADAVVSTTFSAADLEALEAELSAAIARLDAGVFLPRPSEFTCAGCPALDRVCAGPRGRHSGSPGGDPVGAFR